MTMLVGTNLMTRLVGTWLIKCAASLGSPWPPYSTRARESTPARQNKHAEHATGDGGTDKAAIAGFTYVEGEGGQSNGAWSELR
jgi:hypothetical protein